MTERIDTMSHNIRAGDAFGFASWAERIESIGRESVRYGLICVLIWIGGMKFTSYEAEAISAFVANSPLMAWAYDLFSVRVFSALLGLSEIGIALLIATRPYYPRLSALGAAMAGGMFLTTLSFLFTTPGVVELSLGFPALSAMPGQFLIKDLVLLGASILVLGDSLKTAAMEQEA